jgi:hypothetical protein
VIYSLIEYFLKQTSVAVTFYAWEAIVDHCFGCVIAGIIFRRSDRWGTGVERGDRRRWVSMFGGGDFVGAWSWRSQIFGFVGGDLHSL